MWSARSLLLGVVVGVVVYSAQPALAETSTISPTAPLPWSDPTHHSPLEELLGPIESTIAGHHVTARCEDDYDWAALSSQYGLDPEGELGFVIARFYATGAVYDITDYAELSPQVCRAIQEFAAAGTKPTECSSTVVTATAALVTRTRHVAYRVPVTRVSHGVRKRAWVTRYRSVRSNVRVTRTTSAQGPAAPCYDDSGRMRNGQNSAYWSDYERYAFGLLTVAHESIHLGGLVGGLLANGAAVGDREAEARAQCYGMQWMPYVAEQLGADPADAVSVARFTYAHIYPTYQLAVPTYWSPECHANGALDLHLAGQSAIWSP